MRMQLPGIANANTEITVHINKGFDLNVDHPVALVDCRVDLTAELIGQIPPSSIISVTGGEQTKSVGFLNAFVRQHDNLFKNMDALVIVGGGSLINLGNCLAHRLRQTTPHQKPFRLIIIPTTLLAMADAAYGSTGLLNDNDLKSAFSIKYDPDDIFLNQYFLEKLPTDEKKRGLSECLKHALLQHNPAAEDAPTVEECVNLLCADMIDDDLLFSCAMKTIRARAAIAKAVNAGNTLAAFLPSYGHLDAEPREAASDYRLSHGEAVLFGLALETSLSGLHDATDIIRDCIPATPLASKIRHINFDQATMRRSYSNNVRPRFRTQDQDRYRFIGLDQLGSFSHLDANTPIPLIECSFDDVYRASQTLLAALI